MSIDSEPHLAQVRVRIRIGIGIGLGLRAWV